MVTFRANFEPVLGRWVCHRVCGESGYARNFRGARGATRPRSAASAGLCRGPLMATPRMVDRTSAAIPPQLTRQIEQHMAAFSTRLARVTACGGASPPCSSRWSSTERTWRDRAARAERERLEKHALTFGAFLPTSKATYLDRRWRPVDNWAPDYTCEEARRFPRAEGVKVGQAASRSESAKGKVEGSKLLCGNVTYGEPCHVLSVGSNFEDDFELALSRSEGCRSYVVDPTLGAPSDPKVVAFAARLASYGARLNSSIGIGSGTMITPERSGDRPERTNRRSRLASFRELLGGSGMFCAGGKCHVALAKIDAEGGEFDGLLDPRHGAWRLCADGLLTIDQLTVEIHQAPRHPEYPRIWRGTPFAAARMHAIFAGALSCGLMLHSREINWFGCKKGNCAEFAWTSVRHARRVAQRGAHSGRGPAGQRSLSSLSQGSQSHQ